MRQIGLAPKSTISYEWKLEHYFTSLGSSLFFFFNRLFFYQFGVYRKVEQTVQSSLIHFHLSHPIFPTMNIFTLGILDPWVLTNV